MAEVRAYLGDGAYVEGGDDLTSLRVYTRDGTRDTNEVYLDQAAFLNLCWFAKARWPRINLAEIVP